MGRGFYFKTHKNFYYYDDTTGNIKIVEEIPEKDVVFGNKKCTKNLIKEEDVKQELDIKGFTQLTLIVTQGCNIRCKYCVYSGEYDNSRQHTNVNMDFEVAKKALGIYFEYVKQKKTKFPLFIPEVSFYGGEPLVNFKVIKQSVEYIQQIYNGRVDYNITTNACLMTDEIMDFFNKYNFILSISLNGDKEEHDRLRVYANGKGTYDAAIKSLHKLSDKYPRYFKDSCYVIGVYDYGTDLLRMNDFFENEKLLRKKLLMYSPVVEVGTDWYAQYSEAEKERFLKQYNYLKEDYLKKMKKGIKHSQLQDALFHFADLQIINRPVDCSMEELTSGLLPNVGACIPGHKMAVDPYGSIHACERVNDKMPIGTVYTGLNYKKIAEILTKYNQVLYSKCINCPISRLCPHCYQALLDGEGNFDLKRVRDCEVFINIRRNQMIQTYGILEENGDLSAFLYRGVNEYE